ncbi:ABC transporter substrate-binding protein [Desulfococcus sp.]|uniref:ABC transporter substrate-binding protein n=1 Tax=Desulfococcus sp. TaxID=2025834 RepID=UPI003593052E
MKIVRNIIVLWAIVMLQPGGLQAATVVDRAGRRIDVGMPFCRIISLYGAHTENLFALGLGEEIIGVGRNENYPPEALTKPVFSYHDDAEKFMAAKPDLVLVRPLVDRVYLEFVKKLEQAGIAVVSLQPVGVADMVEYWRDLGRLTGREDAAEQMVRRFQQAVAAVTARVAKIPPERRKRVYFEAIHEKMKTFSKSATAIFVLETAGGINVASDADQMRQTNIAAYGKERILARAGEIDVFLAQQGPMNPVSIETIQAEPGFSVIKAVRDNQIYLIDEMIVSRPGLRLIEGILRIEGILYPENAVSTAPVPDPSG